MNNNKKLLNDFQQLSHKYKLKKVINMLKEIRGISQISSDMLDLIKQNPDSIDDELLLEVYTNVINLGSELNGLEKEKEYKKLVSNMDKLKVIQERERLERIEEKGELDAML